jgi:hypothetical protein
VSRFKAPELKVPPVLVDLYYDLRDRRLLPLVALVVVAIAAVPFLLAGSGSSSPSVPASVASALAGEHGAGHAQLAVVQSEPGLRNPSKRLGYLPPKDPFKQQYTGPVLKAGAAATSQTSTSTSTTSSTSTTGSGNGSSNSSSGSSSSGGAPSTPPPSASGGSAKPHLTIFTFAIDLKITKTVAGPNGKGETGKPETRQRVMPPATLPSKKTQVVTYIGIAPKTKKPLFLVSPEVTAVFGEGQCVSGSSSCQLLELEPGFPETFVYGENGVRYKVDLLKVEPVALKHS